MNPDFCEKTVEMKIQVLDESEEPVENAAVQLILTASVAEAGAKYPEYDINGYRKDHRAKNVKFISKFDEGNSAFSKRS